MYHALLNSSAVQPLELAHELHCIDTPECICYSPSQNVSLQRLALLFVIASYLPLVNVKHALIVQLAGTELADATRMTALIEILVTPSHSES